MKNYIRMLVSLMAISAFSFTQAFDHSLVFAVGGLDDCNGSDITTAIRCEQLQSSGGYCDVFAKYRRVESGQPYKDRIFDLKNECMSDGCKNILNNPSPRQDQTCRKHLAPVQMDPWQ
jgi:hypothetical protein